MKIIWKDDDIFELRVVASNGRYSGTTEVYDTSDSLSHFAKSLVGFPRNNETLKYEVGNKNGYAYFAMKFYVLTIAATLDFK